MGFMWLFSGLVNSTEVLENGPRWCCMGVLVDWVMCFGLWAFRVSPSIFIGYCLGHLNGPGLLGYFIKWLIKPKYLIGNYLGYFIGPGLLKD